MIKARTVIISSLALPVMALADSLCPSFQFLDTGHYSVYFRTGEISKVDLKGGTVSMLLKDNDQLITTETAIQPTGTTLVHRRIIHTTTGVGITEELGAAVNILPDGQLIAVQPAVPELGIAASTLVYNGRTLPECLKGNNTLDLTAAKGPITSELAAGKITGQISNFEAIVSTLIAELESAKTAASLSQGNLSQCLDALGLSQNKIAGLESEVAIFDINGNLSRVTLAKSLRRIQSSINDLKDLKGKDQKAIKSLVKAFNKIKARSSRGLFERPAIITNN